MQALLGFTSEARWLRYARTHLRHLIPYLPQQPGYNKRLRKLVSTISWLIGVLGRDTSLFSDDVWIADSAPVECARSRESARRSDLAGFAEYGHCAYGYCASHSRYFWGLRLHLLCTLGGLPVGAALTGAKADERMVLLDILTDPTLAGHRPGQTLIADKNYHGRDFEATLAQTGLQLLRPARNNSASISTAPSGPARTAPILPNLAHPPDGSSDFDRSGPRWTLRGPPTRWSPE